MARPLLSFSPRGSAEAKVKSNSSREISSPVSASRLDTTVDCFPPAITNTSGLYPRAPFGRVGYRRTLASFGSHEGRNKDLRPQQLKTDIFLKHSNNFSEGGMSRGTQNSSWISVPTRCCYTGQDQRPNWSLQNLRRRYKTRP